MLTATVSIAFGGNLLVFVLLVLVAIGAGILFYRFTLPPLPARLRIILASLRSVSLVLLLLILFEPVFQHTRVEDQPPAIAVLIDNSRSITIGDSLSGWGDLVKQFLGRDYLAPVAAKMTTKYYYFSTDLKPLGNALFDSITFNGDETNIANSLMGLKEQLQRENIQAAILISDGNYTAGKNPLYEAEACGIPFYTVGIGDTAEQKDILISKMIVNDLVYAGTRVPVDATIKMSGYQDGTVEVNLNEGAAIRDRAIITLREGVREYPVRFYFDPTEEGMMKITVRVSAMPGEITENNNSRSAFIRVLRSKLTILLVAGGPSSDVSALRQSLVEDQHFTVHTMIQKNPNEFYEGPFMPTLLDTADCIVLIGYPTPTSDSRVLNLIRETIARKRKPILFVNGKNVGYQKLESLAEVLPFTWSSVSTGEVFVGSAIMEHNKLHPLITLEDENTADAWKQLPPIYKCQTVFRAKPEANVLVAVKLQTTILSEPLILVRNVNGLKSFAITGQGIWRWRLLAQSDAQTQQFLPQLISNTIRWLTTSDKGKNVQVAPVKEVFTTAEPVEFNGQVYDEQLKPVANADLITEIKRGAESFAVALTPTGNGQYEGVLNGIGEGEYSYTATATMAGTSYGTDKGNFSVGKTNIEFLETRMNKSLLEQLAFRTGGAYYDVTASERIGEDLSARTNFTSKEIIHKGEIELWNWKYLAVVLIILFGTEWFIRKRNGML